MSETGNWSLWKLQEEGRPKKKKTWDLRDIFSVLVASKVPLVVHNGLVDLIFLYGSLYADLPAALPTFVADLEQMFPAGIYDSKYIAEFSLRTSASFLEFVFRRQYVPLLLSCPSISSANVLLVIKRRSIDNSWNTAVWLMGQVWSRDLHTFGYLDAFGQICGPKTDRIEMEP